MLLRKWDYKKHKYLPFESPAKVVKLYSEDLSESVDCANCGKRMTFGQSYASNTVHDRFGFGYPVCEPCYEAEIASEAKAPKQSPPMSLCQSYYDDAGKLQDCTCGRCH